MTALRSGTFAALAHLMIGISLSSCGHPGTGFFNLPRYSYTYEVPKPITNAWEVSSLSEEGIDSEKITSLIKDILQRQYKNIHGIIILKNGKLVLEEYFDGFHREIPHEIRSVTKSISSILTGIAIDQGLIESTDEKVYTYFKSYEPPEGWDARVKNITIENILTMTSGYDCDDFETGFSCDIGVKNSDDWLRHALELSMAHEPGTYWAYNSASPMLIGEIISRRAKISFEDFASRYLLTPLDIENFQWLHSPKGRVFVAGSAKMRPVDMAKIGYLALSKGKWKDTQIVSERWISESTSRHILAPLHPRLSGSPLETCGYGYLWWTKNFSINRKNVRSFFALGNGGQMIFVFPGLDAVVVFTQGNYRSPLSIQPFEMLTDYILPAMLEKPPRTTAEK